MTVSQPEPISICAVIATFRPNTEALVRVIEAVQAEVDRIVVVDDGSGAFAPRELQQRGIDLVLLDSNRGIGAAQNRGIRNARAHGCTHVLLLDQDSVPEPAMIDHLRSAMLALQAESARVAAVGPRFRASETAPASRFTVLSGLGIRRLNCADTTAVMQTDFLLASGMLIPLAALDDVGGMDEALFIDHVDTEWCLRAKARGYRLYGVCGAMLRHKWGEGVRRVWLGRWRMVHYHKPFRYYYIFRNTLVLFRRRYAPLSWILFESWRLAGLFLIIGLFGGWRTGELFMMARGSLHGIRGMTGRMDSASRP